MDAQKRKRPVSILIRGIYHPEEDDEPMEAELITDGYMYKLGTHWYITYVETETTGYEGCITTLKVSADPADKVGRPYSDGPPQSFPSGRREVPQPGRWPVR